MVTALPVRFLVIFFLCLSTRVFAFDGDPSNAIFVDVNTGSNSNSGAIDHPLQTIEAGIGIATASSRTRVIVSKGTYSESIDAVSGISVYGGYDQSNNWSYSSLNITTIDGAVRFDSVGGATHFEGFNVVASNAAGPDSSSYAVKIVDSSGPIFVQYNTLASGHAANGVDGNQGSNGAAGMSGGNGADGDVDHQAGGTGGVGGSSLCSSGNGGRGGDGGYGKNAGSAGAAGASNPGSGGTGGNSGNPGSFGTAGLSGAAGTAGASAVVNPTTVGAASNGSYEIPAIPLAAAGNPGVSGGGGGGQDSFFSIDGTGDGGGGGGGAGCGGMQATSGQHGGGSFPVFIQNSVATINANRLVFGSGGNGGSGRSGGAGGLGGNGGSGSTAGVNEVGGGGNGANGGHGGSGGGGAGGNGGPAIGIFGTDAGTVTLGTNRFTRSNPTTGGSAGSGSSAGLPGVVQNGSPDNIADPPSPTLSVRDATIPKSFTGSSRALIRVSLGPITDSLVTANFQTIDGTAVAGTDYVSTSGTLVIDPWAATAWIPITILGHVSTPKTFSVVLSAPANATLLKGTATVTIGYDGDIIFRDGFD